MPSVRGFVTLSFLLGAATLGCDYVDAGAAAGAGHAGATGQGGADGDEHSQLGSAGAPTTAPLEATTSPAERACLRVCSLTTQSICSVAETDLATCTLNCESALHDRCASSFTDYLLCAQSGQDVTCPYGPVVQGCEDRFWEFIDCAGLD